MWEKQNLRRPEFKQPSVVRWSTDDLPQEGLTQAWSEVLSDSHLAWQLTQEPAANSNGTIAMRQFNDYRLITCSCDELRGQRSVNEIAQSDGQALSLLYVRQGQEVITIEDQELILQAGDLVLLRA